MVGRCGDVMRVLRLSFVFSVQMFTDRDMVLDALTGGHDNRLLKINDRETQVVSGINAWKLSLVEGVQS